MESSLSQIGKHVKQISAGSPSNLIRYPLWNQFKHKHLLSKEAGRALQNQLFKYAKEIKDLMTENKHWVQNSVSDELASTCIQLAIILPYGQILMCNICRPLQPVQ